MDNLKFKTILKNSLFIILIILFIYITYKCFIYYLPFLIAYVISLIIEPLIVKICDNTNLNRKTSSIIVMFFVFSIFITIIIIGITGIVSETSNLQNKLNNYLDKIITYIDWITGSLNYDKLNLSENIRTIIQNSSKGIVQNFTEILKRFLNSLLQKIYTIPKLIIYLVITILATYFITSDKFYILDRIEHHVPRKIVDKTNLKIKQIKKNLGNYIRAQCILFIITFFVYLVGLNVFKIIGMDVKYPILIALLIFIVDVLPILGAGIIVIPWIIVLFINQNTSLAFSLLGLYLFNTAIRQFVEPKIVSSKIGIHPIFTLIAMYTGFRIIGIFGMFLGPITLIILKNIFSESIEDGIVKTIMEQN